jgi:hypothetical protein
VGKTQWVLKLLDHAAEMVSPPPMRIIWCYGEWQPAYKNLPKHVETCEGLPDLTTLKADTTQPKLMIMDDLMDTLKKDERLTQLFVRGAHHWNVSLIYVVQSLLFGGQRTARINCHYTVLMKSPADKLQIMTLAKQMYPGQTKYFMESYRDATESHPYGYLLVDASPTTEEKYRLRTCIFPGQHEVVYVPKA